MKDLHSWYCTLVVQISNWSNQSRAVQWPGGFSCCSFLFCLINGPSLWICIWNNECIWSVFSNAILILVSKISVSFKILWVLGSVVNIWLVFIAPLQILLSHKLDWKKKKNLGCLSSKTLKISHLKTPRERRARWKQMRLTATPHPSGEKWLAKTMFSYKYVSISDSPVSLSVRTWCSCFENSWHFFQRMIFTLGGKKGNFYFEEKAVSFFSKNVKYSSVYIVQQFFSCNIQSAQQRPSQ